MKRLSKAFFNSAVLLLADAQRKGISIVGTLTDTELPPNDKHWFSSTMVVPDLTPESMGKVLAHIDANEFDDGAIGTVKRIEIEKVDDQFKVKAVVVRYETLTREQASLLTCDIILDVFDQSGA